MHELVRLRDTLFARRARVNLRTLNFLNRWLFDHLRNVDRQLLDVTRGDSPSAPATTA